MGNGGADVLPKRPLFSVILRDDSACAVSRRASRSVEKRCINLEGEDHGRVCLLATADLVLVCDVSPCRQLASSE